MALQSNVNVLLAYGVEASLGAQSGAAGQVLRRVSSTLALQKETFSSNEVRPDQQVFDARHGTRRAQGNITGELSTKTFDDFIEAALRGTWAAGASISQSTPAMSSATLAASNTGTFTASAGSLITAGLRVGDVFRVTGSTGNTGINFRVLALTATVATVSPAPTTATAAGTWSIAVQGKKLSPGVVQRSFTIEQNYPDLDISEAFLGCRVGEFGVAIQPNGIATVNLGLQGVDMLTETGASAPIFPSPTAAEATNLLSGVTGSVSLNGESSAIVTGIDFSINNNLSSSPVIGSVIVPEIFYGRLVVTGTISAYFTDTTFLDYFLNETEVSASTQLDDANGTDFLAFTFPRMKLMGGNKTIGPDGGVLLQAPFQALLASGLSGYNDGSIVIQRSNA